MFKTADGHTVTRAQIAEVFGYRNTQSGRVADVRLTGASLPVSIILDQHPADVAFDIEAAPLVEQVAEEVAEVMNWLGTTSPAYDAEWEAHCDETSATRAGDYPY